MSYTLTSAATATGLNRTTVLRAIKSGKISGTKDEHGEWHIEPAELHRVYPPVAQRDASQQYAPAEDAELRMRAPQAPALPPGETLVAAIAHIRDEITAARNHRRAVETAPLPKADAKALAASHVAVLAGRGKPRVEVGDTFKAVFTDPLADFGVSADFVACTLAWLAPDRMLAALEVQIDALPEPRAPLPKAEREKRLAELTADLDRLDRQEEALIELAAAQGTDLMRRPDAAPAAVSGVVVAQAKAQAA
jgi:hypothetical protein